MTSLKKITIEVGGKKLDFTPEEAKELKTILSDLFGGDRVIERVVERNRWHWWGPYISSSYGNYTDNTYQAQGRNWSMTANAQSGNVMLSAKKP